MYANGLIFANFSLFVSEFCRFLKGLQSGAIHIHPSLRGDLISAGFLKFGRLPNVRGDNIDIKIYILGAWLGLSPANSPGRFRDSVVYLRGLQSSVLYILPGIRGYLISAGFLKFGRLPNVGAITSRREYAAQAPSG